MALQVRAALCLPDEPAQGVLDRTARSGPGFPVLAAKRVVRVRRQRLLPHMSPSLPFRRAHVEHGPASGVAPSRSVVTILHHAFCVTCAWPSSTCQCQVRPN